MEERQLKVYKAIVAFFREIPEFLASLVRHNNGTLEIKVDFSPLARDAVVKSKKKVPPTRILCNQMRLAGFLEKEVTNKSEFACLRTA